MPTQLIAHEMEEKPMTEETRIERVKRFSKIWWQSRADGQKSQEYMALSLGVSKKTIQNWEKGASAPNLFQGFEWFRALGINPMPYYLEFIFPEGFGAPNGLEDDQNIEQALSLMIEQCSSEEKRQLLFIMAGHHGSSWHSLLQMFTAHCHTSMQARVAASIIIFENYEIEEKMGTLVCPEDIQPDMNVLRSAIKQGKHAAQQGETSYFDPLPSL